MAASGKERYAKGEVIIRFKGKGIDLKTSEGAQKAADFSKSKGLKEVRRFDRMNAALFKTAENESVETAVDRLKTDANVEYVQPNFRYYPLAANLGTNDTYANNLWGLNNVGQTVNGIPGSNDKDVNAPEAWALGEGSNDDVVVAVIDTGVAYNHPDLAANMWDGTNCKDWNGNAMGGCNHGYDFDKDDKTPLPEGSSHGTHVAGTVAAVKNNSKGVAGVSAMKTKIMALKSLEGGTTADIIRAINFAKHNGAKVINASFGDYYDSSSGYTHYFLDNALYQAIKDFPGIFVAAAGNDARNHDSGNAADMMYPAGFRADSTAGSGLTNVIAVAATDQNDNLASFSDYGAQSVDVGAPGVNVLSTYASVLVDFEDFEGVTLPNVPTGFTATGSWITKQLDDYYWFKALVTNDTAPYGDNLSQTVLSPAFDLSGAASASVSLWTSCDTQYDTVNWQDYMALDYGTGGSWTEAGKWDEAGMDDYNGDPVDSAGSSASASLSFTIPKQFFAPNFTYRLRFVSNAADNNYGGCIVDDIKVKKVGDGSDDVYEYSDGTSMAAPHVVGLAALALHYNSGATIQEIRNAVVNSGDSIASLSGKTVTGKRINAYKTLLSLSIPSVAVSAYTSSAKTTTIASGAWFS